MSATGVGTAPGFVTGPADWLARYGPYGFRKPPEGSTAVEAWSNVTISPHFPSTAQVVAELYPQSGGRSVDGVVSLDVEAVAALLAVVGSVNLPTNDVTLTERNAAQFLLFDQYELPDAERVDLLEFVSREVFARLIAGESDDPLALGRTLAGPAKQGRVLAWSDDPAVQDVIASAGINGHCSVARPCRACSMSHCGS